MSQIDTIVTTNYYFDDTIYYVDFTVKLSFFLGLHSCMFEIISEAYYVYVYKNGTLINIFNSKILVSLSGTYIKLK